MTTPTAPEAWIRNAAENLIKDARNLGYIVEIGLQSNQPLRMGGYAEVITITEARKPAEDSDAKPA